MKGAISCYLNLLKTSYSHKHDTIVLFGCEIYILTYNMHWGKSIARAGFKVRHGR